MSARPIEIDEGWFNRTAEPVATTQPAPRSIDEMTHGETRRALLDLHHRLNVATLEGAALRKSCEVLERAHCTATEALVRKGDEATALRAALGAAEAVIATLRGRVATLESLAAGPRLMIDDAAVDAIDGHDCDDAGPGGGCMECHCDAAKASREHACIATAGPQGVDANGSHAGDAP